MSELIKTKEQEYLSSQDNNDKNDKDEEIIDSDKEEKVKKVKKVKKIKKIKKIKKNEKDEKDEKDKNNEILEKSLLRTKKDNEMNDIFIKTVLIDKIKLRPYQITSNLKDILQWSLEHDFEGKCTYHGYIRPNSIKIHSYSMGKVFDASLNGDVEFNVQYFAYLCNPAIGSIVPGIITKTNNFGVFVESFLEQDKKKNHSVLEIVVVKTHQLDKSINIDSLKSGDRVNVEILGKKFELNDKKISAWGRIVKSSKNALLDHVELIDDNIRDNIDQNDMIDDDKISLVSDDLSDLDDENDDKDDDKDDVDGYDKDDDIPKKDKLTKTKELERLNKKTKKEGDSEDEEDDEEEIPDGEDLDDDNFEDDNDNDNDNDDEI